jgi:hypothetical protein
MKVFLAASLVCATTIAATVETATPSDGFVAQLKAAIGDRVKHVIVLMEEVRCCPCARCGAACAHGRDALLLPRRSLQWRAPPLLVFAESVL